MIKRLAMTAALILSMTEVCYAADVSSWAKNDFAASSKRGLLTTDIVCENLSDSITRAEFCKLIMNLYCVENDVLVKLDDRRVFDDTFDEAVLKAYKLGIVNGKGDGHFCPDDSITRQEMAVMISRLLTGISSEYSKLTNQVKQFVNKFDDCVDTAEWALSDMAAVYSLGIISGYDESHVHPLDNATREQAICMINRVYNTSITRENGYQIPVIKNVSEDRADTHIISMYWDFAPNAKSYEVIIKSNGCVTQTIEKTAKQCSVKQFDTGIDAMDEYSVYVVAYLGSGKQVFSEPVDVIPAVNNKQEKYVIYSPAGKYVDNSNISDTSEKNIQNNVNDIPDSEPEYEKVPEKNTAVQNTAVKNTEPEYNEGAELTLEQKEERVFPNGEAFKSSSEAAEHMVYINVPIWCMKKDNTKYRSSIDVEVNENLADDVLHIFEEIFNDPSQFPIKDIGGYCWRNTAGGKLSQHSFGTCIDINYNENYYVEPDGTPITGSYWKPGEDPYSIAEDSIVVKTFAKYGWKWGGNAWGDKYARDYMHFTYLGK